MSSTKTWFMKQPSWRHILNNLREIRQISPYSQPSRSPCTGRGSGRPNLAEPLEGREEQPLRIAQRNLLPSLSLGVGDSHLVGQALGVVDVVSELRMSWLVKIALNYRVTMVVWHWHLILGQNNNHTSPEMRVRAKPPWSPCILRVLKIIWIYRKSSCFIRIIIRNTQEGKKGHS